MSAPLVHEVIRALGRASGIAALGLVTAMFTPGDRCTPYIPVLSPFLRILSGILSIPAVLILRVLRLGAGGNATSQELVLLVLLDLALYGTLFFFLDRRFRRRARRPAVEAAFQTRRALLVQGAVVLGGAAGVVTMARDKENVEVRARELVLPGLPEELAGLRVVLVSDLHRGPYNSLDYLVRVADLVNAERPDLVLVPGDFVHGSGTFFPEVAEVLARLRPRCGMVGTLGNHDHWEGPDLARSLFPRAGLRLVDNSRLFLSPGRELVAEVPERGLCLGGVGDLWQDRQDLEAALGGVPRSMPRLLLSHNPDFAEDPVPPGHRVDLQLSGHTHGGQVSLPLVGSPVVPSRFGNRYAEGLVRGPRWPVYITRGIGTTVLPLRFRARPEITVLVLRPGVS